MPGGPNTKAGKAVVKFNPVTHGLRTHAPVIPGLETAEDWQAHRSGILPALAPQGALESELAERVALLLWRLKRVARFETTAVAQTRADAPDEYARGLYGPNGSPGNFVPRTHPDELREVAESAASLVRELERLPNRSADSPVPWGQALDLFDAVQN